jgi:IclR family pca regulon transcriptional regulator
MRAFVAQQAKPAIQDRIGAFEKGLALMECLTKPPGHWTITEVAALADVSRATARRYLLTLVATGHMKTDGKRFSLTARMLRFGDAYLTSSNLPRIVQPVVERLSFLAQDSASVGIMDGDDVVYIARSGNSRVVSTSLRPGARCPLYCTAGGRILLSAMTIDACRAHLRSSELKLRTPQTRIGIDDIVREVVKSRSQGYAIVDQEFELGLRTIAVPMLGTSGTCGAIAITGRSQQMSEALAVATYLPMLFEAQSLIRELI